MNKILNIFFIVAGLIGLIIFFNACDSKPKNEPENTGNTGITEIETDQILTNKVLTQEEQEKLTPQQVLDILKEGNKDFINDNLTVRNNTERVRDAALKQYPKAAVLSCLDSRVPVEDVFHRGIGDIFVARVAGNIVNEDILGSLEYACAVSGSKLIVVLGHEYCGAIKSAIDDVDLGNITGLLTKIKPAINATNTNFSGEKTSENPQYVEAVCHENVILTMQQIREKSPILKQLEEEGKIMIVGGVYDMETGRVDFIK